VAQHCLDVPGLINGLVAGFTIKSRQRKSYVALWAVNEIAVPTRSRRKRSSGAIRTANGRPVFHPVDKGDNFRL
jgi:hypothetical protein